VTGGEETKTSGTPSYSNLATPQEFIVQITDGLSRTASVSLSKFATYSPTHEPIKTDW